LETGRTGVMKQKIRETRPYRS